jgi:hypothetical protein
MPRQDHIVYIKYESDFEEFVNEVLAYPGELVNGILENDLDVSSLTFDPIGTAAAPYLGIFEGNGHTLTYAMTRGEDYAGLFGVNQGTIQNLKVKAELTVKASATLKYVGGVAAYNGDRGVIQNILVTDETSITVGAELGASVDSIAYIGGAAGYNNGLISSRGTPADITTVKGRISVDATRVAAVDYVGGVAGYNDINALIQKVVSWADINPTTPNNIHNIGGIAGFNGWDSYNEASPHFGGTWQAGGVVSQCRNHGAINGGFNKIGGIVGENAYRVVECSNYGMITVEKSLTGWVGAGGIVGRNGNNNIATEQGSIEYCYNRGDVEDDATSSSAQNAYGGITGWCNDTSDVQNCYTTGELVPGRGQKNPIIGQADSSTGRGRNNYSKDDIYASSSDPVLTGIRESETYMKSADFVEDLNNGSTYYVVNPDDYPILGWETGTFF